jgi:hypothetical protein
MRHVRQSGAHLVLREAGMRSAQEKPRDKNYSVFLNIPYDKRFEKLYLAFIVGLVELGLTPKVTLGIPSGATRIDRIFELLKSCRYSVHDLSRVEMDRRLPPTPRFNMPFELGLAFAWSRLTPANHDFFAFESINRRAQKSLSDLSGTDFNIHDNRPNGIMRELRNVFDRRQNKPTVPRMMKSYNQLLRRLPALRKAAGTADLFQAGIFRDIVAACVAIRNSSRPDTNTSPLP